jgi:hypothetical protein
MADKFKPTVVLKKTERQQLMEVVETRIQELMVQRDMAALEYVKNELKIGEKKKAENCIYAISILKELKLSMRNLKIQ